jgi:iron complex outermembrane receptor protein
VLDDFVWSPRVAFVYKPEPNHALRATYNRAFSTPTTNNLFLDLLARVVPLGGPFFYPINTQGVRDGFAFSRTDGRADMKSPFALLLGQSPTAFMPTTTENLWALAVAALVAGNPALGPLLGSLPVPNESQVGIVTRLLDTGSGTFILDPRGVDGIEDIPAIQNQITNTIEAGYKGLIAEKFLIGIDFYYTLIEDFIGPLRIETPNAFLNGGDIAAYLAGFGIPPELAGEIAQGMAQIPLGVITPEGVTVEAAPLLLTYRNFGNVDLFGADLSAQYQATPEWAFGLTASWVSDDTFDADGLDVALNATRFKMSIGAGYDHLGSGFMADAKFRYIDGFPANSGVFVGPVDSYSPVDVTLGWQFADKGVMLQLDVTNIFDESYQSFPGTPILGRVALFRIVYNTP